MGSGRCAVAVIAVATVGAGAGVALASVGCRWCGVAMVAMIACCRCCGGHAGAAVEPVAMATQRKNLLVLLRIKVKDELIN
jgi:hypothetical protein